MSLKDEMIRVTAELDVTDVRILARIAKLRGITPREAMRRAIQTAGLLQQRREEGWQVLTHRPEETRELIFRM